MSTIDAKAREVQGEFEELQTRFLSSLTTEEQEAIYDEVCCLVEHLRKVDRADLATPIQHWRDRRMQRVARLKHKRHHDRNRRKKEHRSNRTKMQASPSPRAQQTQEDVEVQAQQCVAKWRANGQIKPLALPRVIDFNQPLKIDRSGFKIHIREAGRPYFVARVA